MATKLEYTASNPLAIQARQDKLFSGFPILAWSDPLVEGGIRVKINCQDHPIAKWEKDCEEIVKRHVVSLRSPVRTEELNNIIFEENEANVIKRLAALVKTKKELNKGDIKMIKDICNGMAVAIEAIKAMVAPGKKPKVKKEVVNATQTASV